MSGASSTREPETTATEDTGADLRPGGTTYVADHHRDASAGPEPDADIKPSSPTRLTKRSWRYIGKKTLAEFQDDQCTDIAASLTYYAVLALFPGLIALTSILGLVGQSGEAVEVVLDILRPLVSEGVYTLAEDALGAMTESSAAGFALVFGLLGALFSASGYVNAFSRAMNRIYEVQEGRPIYKLRPMMILVTLMAVLLAASVLVMLVVSGPLAESIGREVGQVIGLENATVSTVVFTWAIVKWPLVFVIVVGIVALLYYATPNVQQPRFRWVSLGALIAIAVAVLASVGFFLYVSNFGSYDATYGALAGVIILLLWIYLINVILLFGAEVDSEIERGRELQAGIPAEDELQLPPRDTRASDKRARKYAEDVERGRNLRESAGRSQEDPAAARDGERRGGSDSDRRHRRHDGSR